MEEIAAFLIYSYSLVTLPARDAIFRMQLLPARVLGFGFALAGEKRLNGVLHVCALVEHLVGGVGDGHINALCLAQLIGGFASSSVWGSLP